MDSEHIILNHFNHYNRPYNELIISVKNDAIISFDGMVVGK